MSHPVPTDEDGRVSRRGFLFGLGTATAFSLAGCMGFGSIRRVHPNLHVTGRAERQENVYSFDVVVTNTDYRREHTGQLVVAVRDPRDDSRRWERVINVKLRPEGVSRYFPTISVPRHEWDDSLGVEMAVYRQ